MGDNERVFAMKRHLDTSPGSKMEVQILGQV